MSASERQFYLEKGSPLRSRFEKWALIIGIIGVIFAATGYFVNSRQFYYSYLTAFAYWATLGLGGLFFVMLHHLSNSTWSIVLRRQAETVMSVLPYLAILFVPILPGLKELYPWANGSAAADLSLGDKSAYLNIAFFIIRGVVYLAAWSLLAVWLYRISRKQDDGHTQAIVEKTKKISAAGMVVFAVTITFASFDWFMSQSPKWYSTIFGVYIFAGASVSIMAFLTIISLALRGKNILADVITIEHYHDLGKLTFTFVVFWAYIAFSQYFLIWYADIPEETVWFSDRWGHGWQYFSVLLVFGYFVLPFLLLISRPMKRRISFMKIMAFWLLFMHWVDLYWVIMPNSGKENAMISWIDIASMAGIGGIFMWFFWRRFLSAAMVPVNDPRLEQSIKMVNY